MKNSKSSIQAVLDSDLEKLLVQTNQLAEFIEGKIHCPVCGSTITEDNIGVLYPEDIDGHVRFEIHCNNINCLSK